MLGDPSELDQNIHDQAGYISQSPWKVLAYFPRPGQLSEPRDAIYSCTAKSLIYSPSISKKGKYILKLKNGN